MTRDMIVAAARAVFVEKGFHDARISEIVRKVGGSNRNIYENFGDKFGLYRAVIDSFQERMMAGFLDDHVEHADIATWLHAFARAYVRSSADRETVALHRLSITEASRFPELGASVLNQAEDRLAEMVMAKLIEQAKAGTVTLDDPEYETGALLAMLRGELHLRISYGAADIPEQAVLDAHAAKAVTLFLKAIAVRKG